jgi:hypothetical protein
VRSLTNVCVETGVRCLGSASEGSEDTSRCPVGVERQHVRVPFFKEFRECELKERECTRLMLDITDDAVDESGLECDTDTCGRFAHNRMDAFV